MFAVLVPVCVVVCVWGGGGGGGGGGGTEDNIHGTVFSHC